MKLWRILFFAGLSGSPLAAQLVLPDFYVEEDPDTVLQPEMPLPVDDGAHARPEGEGERTAPEQLEQQLEQQMRQMMQSMQGRGPSIGHQAEQEGDAVGIWREFLEGPDVLVAEIENADGRRIRLSVPNQTVKIETKIGVMPVRLHEVVRIVNVEGAEVFVVTFRDGDQIVGGLERIHFPDPGEDGRFRALPLAGMKGLSLDLPE